MDHAVHVALARQTGLMRELQVVANNIANAATAGFRQEGLVFSEFVQRPGGTSPVSMAAARVRTTSQLQGTLKATGGRFDLAIEGEGFFQVETPEGMRLTRAGTFSPGPAGEMLTPQGHRLLDEGGAPVFVPPGTSDLAVAADGTLSADGRPLTRIGLVRPLDPAGLTREAGVLFRPAGEVEPAGGTILQGFVEASNVDPLGQIARMVEVQRAYEMGQSFLDAENDRVRDAIKTLAR